MKVVCLLRGVNVGGKNKLSMAELKAVLSAAGFKDVTSYINSGNLILETSLSPTETEREIEKLISSEFKLDSELIKVLVLSKEWLTKIVKNAPRGFGTEPDKYYCDVLFPMGVEELDVLDATRPNPDVDKAYGFNGVVYYQRLAELRTKSWLSRIITKPIYKSLTIRSWKTTVRLLELLNA